MLFVSNLYPPDVLGGYEILCARVAAAFRVRGHEIAVLTTGGAGATGPAGETLFRDLRLFLPFGEKPRLARSARQAVEGHNRQATKAALRDFRPDLVFVWSQLRLGLAAAREAEREGYM